MPTPKWLTGRSRQKGFSITFSMDAEVAPIGGSYGHWLKYSDLVVTCGSSADFPPFAYTARVRIYPSLYIVPGSSSLRGHAPYPDPDAFQAYQWLPAHDPGGGWTRVYAAPISDVYLRWNIQIAAPGTAASSNAVNVGSSFESYSFWDDGGYVGYIGYSATGVPGGTPIPPQVFRGIPDGGQRTHGPTYSHTLTGTITFDAGEYEEYFINSDDPFKKVTVGGVTKIPREHQSELGDYRNPSTPGMPFGRTYAERKSPTSPLANVVVATNAGTWSLNENPAGFGYVLMDTSVCHLQGSAVAHALGGGASVTSNLTYDYDDLGGFPVSLPALSDSSSWGSASPGAVAATSTYTTGAASYDFTPSVTNFFLYNGILVGNAVDYQQTVTGVLYGAASTVAQFIVPQSVTIDSKLLRMQEETNTVLYDLEFSRNLTPGGTPTGVTLRTITDTDSFTIGHDNSVLKTIIYNGFASYVAVTNTILNGSGGSTFYDPPPASLGYPLGVRLVGTNSLPLSRCRLAVRGKCWDLYDVTLSDSGDVLADPFTTRVDSTGTTTSVSGGILSLTTTLTGGYTTITPTNSSTESRHFKLKVRSVGSDNESGRIWLPNYVLGHDFVNLRFTTGLDGVWTEIEFDSLEDYSSLVSRTFPGYARWLYTILPTLIQLDSPSTIEIEWIRGYKNTFALLDSIDGVLIGVMDGSPYLLSLVASDILTTTYHNLWEFVGLGSVSGSKPWGHEKPYNKTIDDSSYFNQADWYDRDNYGYLFGLGMYLCGGGWSTFLHVGVGDLLEEGEVIPEEVIPGGDAIVPPVVIEPGDPEHTLVAQELFEWVVVYPGAGDVFGVSGGAYGINTTLRMGLLLGSMFNATLVGQDPMVAPPDVIVNDATPTEVSRGELETGEYYTTTDPGIPVGSHEALLDPEVNTAQRYSFDPPDKTIYYTLWFMREPIQGDILAQHVDGTGRLFTPFIDEDGKLKLSRCYQKASGQLGFVTDVGSHEVTEISADEHSSIASTEITGLGDSVNLGGERHGNGCHVVASILVGAGLPGDPVIYISSDSGETWIMETIPGSYSAIDMVEKGSSLILFGWRSDNWYTRVGTSKSYIGGSGDVYDWSDEELVVATTNNSGKGLILDSGIISFTYIDSSGDMQRLQCEHLAIDGTGTWV